MYYSTIGHIVAGGFALLAYWATFLTRKGSLPHKQRGRVFFVSLVVVVGTVAAILLLRGNGFTPDRMIQLAYLTVAMLTAVMLGWTAIRMKHDVERFRGLHFRILGPVLFALGLVVLAGGIASSRTVVMILSLVGLVVGAMMIRFAWLRRPPHPKWWLGWHLVGVCGLFHAVHGSLLAVLYRAFVDASAYEAALIVSHTGTMAIAVALRLYFGHKRGVPLRFSQPATARGRPAVA